LAVLAKEEKKDNKKVFSVIFALKLKVHHVTVKYNVGLATKASFSVTHFLITHNLHYNNKEQFVDNGI
jgi:hypothetical protein